MNSKVDPERQKQFSINFFSILKKIIAKIQNHFDLLIKIKLFYMGPVKNFKIIFYKLTGIGPVTVGPGRLGPVSGFDLEGVSSLLLAIEHHLGFDDPGFSVDLKEAFPLVSRTVDDVVRDL